MNSLRLAVRTLGLLIIVTCLCLGEGSELRIAMRSDPRTTNPLLVDEEAGELVRYLTSGVLIRINRASQQAQPELALRWRWTDQNRMLVLHLRPDVRFSDGSAFTAADVVHTFTTLMDPGTNSPLADAFRTGKGPVKATATGSHVVALSFPSWIAGIERLLDQVPICPEGSTPSAKVGLGPFTLATHVAGSHVVLKRNPNYWKRDAHGKQLPYLQSIRLDIQSNRDVEALRFRRGELDAIRGLDAELFRQLKAGYKGSLLELGAGYDSEMLWFNQVASAPLPAARKAWYRTREFRKAVSLAINRADIVRLVYGGHAEAAAGPYTAANAAFYNPAIRPDPQSITEAKRLLAGAGFGWKGTELFDSNGSPVQFTVITNSGNKARARIASMIQQDLKPLGISVKIVSLDFPSLIERITKTFDYDACLLGLVNVDADPNGQMNVWMSSGANHQWNPRQRAPETPWEGEIDKLMKLQATTPNAAQRRSYFYRVQQIIADQAPFIYLVAPKSLAATKGNLKGVSPSPMRPHLLWNAEYLYFDGGPTS